MQEAQIARGALMAAATSPVVASTTDTETSSETLETTDISTNETDDTDRTQVSRQDQTTPANIEANQLISVNTVNKQTIGFPDVLTHKIRFRLHVVPEPWRLQHVLSFSLSLQLLNGLDAAALESPRYCQHSDNDK
jgi:hypothetical protein